MTAEMIRAALGWCTLINWAILLLWVIFLKGAHDFVFNVHGKMISVSVEEFDAIHYKGMMYYKIGIVLFNFAPYLALRIVI